MVGVIDHIEEDEEMDPAKQWAERVEVCLLVI
jgi:hypothetical protein